MRGVASLAADRERDQVARCGGTAGNAATGDDGVIRRVIRVRSVADVNGREASIDCRAAELPSGAHQVREVNPDLRIIYLLRDPVERSWSSAISGLARRRGRSPEKITDKQLLRHFKRQAHILRTDYMRTYEIWENAFGHDQIFVGFLDEIQQDPRDLLMRIYRFLGVSASEEHIPAGLGRKVNSSREYSTAIPENVRIHLAELYLPQLQELSERFGEPATEWLRRAEESLERSGAGSA